MIWHLLIIGFLAIGCAGQSARHDNWPARNPYYISFAEITVRPDITTAYEAVLTLRPHWLSKQRPSPQGDLVRPSVAVDIRLVGGIGELHNIPAGMIGAIRYLDQNESLSRFGSNQDYSAGVIWVRLLY